MYIQEAGFKFHDILPNDIISFMLIVVHIISIENPRSVAAIMDAHELRITLIRSISQRCWYMQR